MARRADSFEHRGGVWSLFLPEASTVKPGDFAGQFRFTHDGWPGVLTIQDTGSRIVRGTYIDSRLDQRYDVTGRIDVRLRHRIEFVIREFNWVPEQRFLGYLFTRGKHAIAGTTSWKEMPFGFIASRSETLPRETFRPGDVEPADFAGIYDVQHDGLGAVVELEHTTGTELRGTFAAGDRGDALDIIASVGAGAPNAIQMVLTDRDAGPAPRITCTGYLFSRPKNAIAGWTECDGVPASFYMIKRS